MHRPGEQGFVGLSCMAAPSCWLPGSACRADPACPHSTRSWFVGAIMFNKITTMSDEPPGVRRMLRGRNTPGSEAAAANFASFIRDFDPRALGAGAGAPAAAPAAPGAATPAATSAGLAVPSFPHVVSCLLAWIHLLRLM